MASEHSSPTPSADPAKTQAITTELNEALILGAVRQHEYTDAVERLNAQLQEATRELAENARLLDLSNDAIVVRDVNGKITSWNMGAEKLYGWTSTEVTGRDLDTLLQTEIPRPWEEIAAQLELGGVFVEEVVQVARDGRRIPSLCRWVLDRGTRSILISSTDISERKRTEETLRASESLFSTLIEQAPGAVFALDADLCFRQLNPKTSALFDHVGPLIGRPFAEVMEILWGVNVMWKIMDIFRHTLATGECYIAHDFYELRADLGVSESYEWEIQRILLPCGDFGLVCYFTEVTERRLLEESLVARAADLAQADRSKDEFLAMLAHELRNPLAPLRNAAEILQTAGVSDNEREQAQHIIHRQIENMSRMIDDLLDVSRITEGKIELRKAPVALEAILIAATSLVRSNCAARHQDLAVSMPAEPVFLQADATRLEQVFSNLLSNACKYSDEGCHIWLSAERAAGIEPPEVMVRVRDDGAGIDAELLPRVFDLFVQATRSLDRAHGGLGIGLTLVNRLVKLHGGSVEVHSEGLGHGSEFIVHLPILRHALPPAPPPPPAAREIPRRILIVDDNSDSARSMASLQARRGHVTRTAFNGPDALSVAADFSPEFVLLDIGLPGMDGYEVARQLRQMPNMAKAFLIAMTGYSTPGDLIAARKAGFNEHLVKPVDLDTLRDWLRKMAY